jgi:hypothetical protein
MLVRLDEAEGAAWSVILLECLRDNCWVKRWGTSVRMKALIPIEALCLFGILISLMDCNDSSVVTIKNDYGEDLIILNTGGVPKEIVLKDGTSVTMDVLRGSDLDLTVVATVTRSPILKRTYTWTELKKSDFVVTVGPSSSSQSAWQERGITIQS